MCAIAGVLRLDGGLADPEPVATMSRRLVHRGPDGQGISQDGPVCLAHRRLAIIDPAAGRQPMHAEDGQLTVVCNGEIYNHLALRSGLVRAGHRFATRCDSEVLVHGWEEHGPALLERLRGMWALAVWEAREQRLTLAVDPFAVKPLYVHADAGRLAFASELGALRTHPGVPSELDPDALQAFLAFNAIPPPLTILRGVRKLCPGQLLVAAPGRPVEVRTWARPRPAPEGELASGSAGELRDRLRTSVRAHMVADVPVGVFLSGGIDSGAIAALAAETVPRLSTFSVGFTEASFDERSGARLVAERYGTDHHEVELGADRAAELLPEVAAAFDEPFADSSMLPTWLVSRLARSRVTVALSGEGGDELFGGYLTYAASNLARRIGPAAAWAAPLAERLPSGDRRVGLEYKARRFTAAAALAPLERHHAFKEILAPELRAELLGARGDGADPVELLRDRFRGTAGAEPIARLQDVDLGVLMVADQLTKSDRASMAHSLEVRVPFCDVDLAAYAHGLPRSDRVRRLRTKVLLREAVAPLLPAAVVDGPKRGFSMPTAAWLRGPLAPLAREVLDPAALLADGVLDPAPVGRLVAEHAARRADHSRAIWGLLCLSLWLRR